MNTIKNYDALLVWQTSMQLVHRVYKTSSHFLNFEKYALASQLRSSAVSVPSNSAEEHGRSSIKYYMRLLHISMGSLFELQTQLEIAFNQEYVSEEIFKLMYSDSHEIDRMLRTLIRNLS